MAVLILGGSAVVAGEQTLKQKDVDAFYAMCWRELEASPPKLERPDAKSLPQRLSGLYEYEYRDKVSGDTVKGSITFRYPEWDWRSDSSKGSAKQFDDKIVLLGNGDESKMRAFLLRIGGEWHIMQMDFPGGLVKLTKAEPDAHEPPPSVSVSMPPDCLDAGFAASARFQQRSVIRVVRHEGGSCFIDHGFRG